jgi:hypothetical protein
MTPRWSVSRRSLRLEERLLPLLQRYPEVWAVLRRHGVGAQDVPGPTPTDSIATFATSHHLDPAQFRDDCSAILRLRIAGRETTESLCRAYLIGGVLLTLATSAFWTLWLALGIKIGMGRPFGPLDLPAIQSHAEIQVYGLVGLLSMGLSYAVLPRIWRGRLVAPRLAGLILGLMLTALLVRAVVWRRPSRWRPSRYSHCSSSPRFCGRMSGWSRSPGS